MTDTPERGCTALVPYVPPAPPARKSFIAHLITFICALLCLLSVTVGGINVIMLASTYTPETAVLRLANRAFFGTYTVSLSKPMRRMRVTACSQVIVLCKSIYSLVITLPALRSG